MHNTPSAAATPSTVHCASGMCLYKIWSLLCQWQRACLPVLSCALQQVEYTLYIMRPGYFWRRECCRSSAIFY